MTEMIFAGFGGQGILTTGIIAATAGMKLGYEVTWYPSYGAQMRGGTANCSVKFDTKPIASPYVKKIDILCAMNEPSIEKFQANMKTDGLLLADSGTIPDNLAFRDDIKVIMVPVTKIADECGNPRGANLVMLGAIAAHTDLFNLDELERIVDDFFAKKGKVNPKNVLCLRKGAECE